MPLPPFLIASLYKRSLVIVPNAGIPLQPDPKPHTPIEPKPVQWYLGENKKKVTIVVNQQATAYLTDEQFALLTGILKACKLNMADVAIVNLAHAHKNFLQLNQSLDTRYLLLFDVTTAAIQLPFSIPLYQLQAYDQCQILQAASLQSMLGDDAASRDEKMKLWNALRKMFAL